MGSKSRRKKASASRSAKKKNRKRKRKRGQIKSPQQKQSTSRARKHVSEFPEDKTKWDRAAHVQYDMGKPKMHPDLKAAGYITERSAAGNWFFRSPGKDGASGRVFHTGSARLKTSSIPQHLDAPANVLKEPEWRPDQKPPPQKRPNDESPCQVPSPPRFSGPGSFVPVPSSEESVAGVRGIISLLNMQKLFGTLAVRCKRPCVKDKKRECGGLFALTHHVEGWTGGF